MKQINNILIIIIGVAVMISCNKQIEEKQSDPNNPTSVPPNLIVGTVLTDMSGMGTAGTLGGIKSWGSVAAWDQYYCENHDYFGNNIYSWTNGSFDPYLVLKNVVQMRKEAISRGSSTVNPIEAVGRFINAYYYYNLTNMFGDVPMADALQGAANAMPSYTPQEQIFQFILNELDTANTDLASLISSNDNSLSASQDIYYGGDLTKWQKLVNSFKLRVLIDLSSKASDAVLNVPTQFADIVSDPSKYPIFTSQADDLKFKYNPVGDNIYSSYPLNPSSFSSIAPRFNMASTYVDALKSINDPRIFITCEPASALLGNDPNPCQFKYFVGASTGEPVQSMFSNAGAGLYSFINRSRYFSNFTGEPNVLVGYKEMLFNIAEGIERGWATVGAETFYKTGITESMAFYGMDITQTNFTAYFLPAGANNVTQVAPYPFSFNFSNYYAQSAVQLSSTPATAIDQIVMQKYLVMFQNSGYEGYYNWRRTGVPAFQSGAGVGNNGVIPLRWAYPVTEQVQNKANWSSALAAQQFSTDDLNQTMWLLK